MKDNFWYDYYNNGIYGPGYRSHKKFKFRNLAFVIAVITIIILIFYIIFHG
jgi:hypothetical protein